MDGVECVSDARRHDLCPYCGMLTVLKDGRASPHSYKFLFSGVESVWGESYRQRLDTARDAAACRGRACVLSPAYASYGREFAPSDALHRFPALPSPPSRECPMLPCLTSRLASPPGLLGHQVAVSDKQMT